MIQQELVQLRLNLQKLERVNGEITNNKFDTFYNNELANLNQNQDRVGEIIARDREQAEKFQVSFNTFDTQYFKEYCKLAKGTVGDVTSSNVLGAGRKSLLSGVF